MTEPGSPTAASPRTLVGDLGWAAVGTGAEFAASILLAVLLARHFGPVAYGLLPLMAAVVDVPRMISYSAIGTSFTKHVAETRTHDEDVAAQDPGKDGAARSEAVGAALVTGLIILAVFGVAAGLVVAALAEPLARLMGRPDLVPLLRVGAVVVAAFSLFSWVTNGEQGLGRVDRLAQARAGAAGLRLVLTLVLVFVAGAGLIGVAVSAAMTYVVATLFFAAVFYPAVRGRLRRPTWAHARVVLLYSLPLALSWAVNFGYRRIDMILVGVFVPDPRQVSYFAIAVAVAGAPTALMAPVSLAALPRVARLSALRDLPQRARLFEQGAHTVAMVYVPMTFAVVILARSLFEAILPQYVAAVPLVMVLCLALVPQVLGTLTVGSFLTPSGKAGVVARITAVAATVNILLDLALIPWLGALGSVLGSLAVVSATGIATLVLAGRLLDLPLRWRAWVGRPLAAACVAGAAAFLVSRLGSGYPWVALLAGSAVMIVLYWVVLVAVGGVTENDRRLLRAVLRLG